MAVVATPAWNLPSGHHTIITPAGRPVQPAANRPTRMLLYSAAVLGGLSAIAWWAYSHLGWERLVTVGQMCALLSGVCIIAVCHLRAQREQHRADLARVHLHIRDALAEGVQAIHDLGTLRGELRDQKLAITAGLAAIADLPEQLRDRVDRQAVGYQAVVREMEDRLAGRVAKLAEKVEAAEQERDRLAREHVALALAVHDQLQAIEAGTRQHAEFARAVRNQLRAIEAGAVEARKRAAAAEQDRERMAKEHIGFAKLVLQQLHGIGTGVGDLRERVDGTDRRLDELVETIEQVATAGAIVAAQVPGNGQVHQLRPPTPRRGR